MTTTPKVKVHVSGHALERYLERAMGIDVAGARHRIEKLAQIAFDAGAVSVTIDSIRLPITKNGVVTTAVLTDKVGRMQQKDMTYGTRQKPPSRRPRRIRDRRPDTRREDRGLHHEED